MKMTLLFLLVQGCRIPGVAPGVALAGAGGTTHPSSTPSHAVRYGRGNTNKQSWSPAVSYAATLAVRPVKGLSESSKCSVALY